MAIVESAGSLEAAFLALRHIKNDPDFSNGKHLAEFTVMLKKDIRAFLNRKPERNKRIIKGDYDGYTEVEQLPDELDSYTEEQVDDWFQCNRYLEAYPSQYDCTGQSFTIRYHLTRRNGHWIAYHVVGRDV